MTSEGRDVPPFDKEEEDVGQSHEVRREDIRDNVEEKREDRAEHLEEKRSDRAKDLEEKRIGRAENVEEKRVTRADELEALTIRRLRFIAYAAAAAAIIASAVAAVGFVQAVRINDNADRIDRNIEAVKQVKRLQKQVDAESEQRRSDTCRSFEQQHKEEVDNLARTYRYLARLTPEDRALGINRSVYASLVHLERDARSDQDDNGIFVPTYCDDKGVGLPEPDPTVPSRPEGLKPPPKAQLPLP